MNMKKVKDIPRFEYETVQFYCVQENRSIDGDESQSLM